jgi:hypothetical protein
MVYLDRRMIKKDLLNNMIKEIIMEFCYYMK